MKYFVLVSMEIKRENHQLIKLVWKVLVFSINKEPGLFKSSHMFGIYVYSLNLERKNQTNLSLLGQKVVKSLFKENTTQGQSAHFTFEFRGNRSFYSHFT